MNRNVMIGALIAVTLILVVFVGKLREEQKGKDGQNTQVQSTSQGANVQAKDSAGSNVQSAEKKDFSEDEVLTKLKGYWVIPSEIKINDEFYQYQFYFKQVANPDLKGGHKVQGYLFCNHKENNGVQTMSLLEPVRLAGNSYSFDLKQADIGKFYGDGGYDDEGTFNKVIVEFNGDEIGIRLKGLYEASASAKLVKIDLGIVNEFKSKLSANRSDDKAKINLDLSHISDIESDTGSFKYKSEGCTSETTVKARPLSDKLLLVSAGGGSSCVSSVTMKIAKGENNSFQALVYKKNEVPYELNFEKN